MESSIKILKALRYPNGLFSASKKDVNTGYNKAWIRDCIYSAMGMEVADMDLAINTYRAIFNILLKHENKIDWAVMEKPKYRYQYIHARFSPETLDEIWEDWGNKQNDAIGLLLFKVADLTKKGHQIIRHRHDFRILQKLVFYLESVEYWKDDDNGIWEENEEMHSSSIGACVAALKLLTDTIFEIPMMDDDHKFKELLQIKDKAIFRRLHIDHATIQKGQESLNNLLPNESETKTVDLALLSLIYPYQVTTEEQTNQILYNIEKNLVKYNGVIRYKGDKYYGNEFGEARWTMGFPWLAIINHKLGNSKKYHFYMYKTHLIKNKEGELPELYYANTNEYNENTPLGWSQSLYLIASSLKQEDKK